MSVEISGDCHAEYHRVIDAFSENFAQRGEAGAAFAVYLEGEKIIDIWGGMKDRQNTSPWQQNTLVNVFSAGKGVVALCALQLRERSLLDFDAPVADYWPEFAAQGKEQITVRQALCHRSGLPAITQSLADDAVYDWQTMVAALEAEPPGWPPGDVQGYHVFTFGWILGELIRRVSGLSIGKYIQQHIVEPSGLDFYVGLGLAEMSRCADVAPRPPRLNQDLQAERKAANKKPAASPGRKTAQPKPDPLAVCAMSTPAALFRGSNSGAWRRAEIPAGNGHSDARSLAAIYGALATDGVVNGHTLLGTESLAECYSEYSCASDRVLGLPMRFGPGFMLHGSPAFKLGGKNSFGHTGNGGGLAFADPEKKLGIAYVTNRLAHGDRRGKVLVDAVYQSGMQR